MDKYNLLHQPLQVKNLENQDQVLFIKGMKNGNFEVVFLDAHFKQLPNTIIVPVKALSMFLDSPDCRNLKAVMFFLIDNNNTFLIVNLEIRQMVNEEVRKRKWPVYLVHPKALSFMSTLFAADLTSKPGDVILNAYSLDETVTVYKLQRKPQGYSYIGFRNINNSFNRNVNDVAIECLGACNPDYVIVGGPQCYDLAMSLKSRVVPSNNVINIVSDDIDECTHQVLKSIFEKGYCQLIPFSMDILVVTNDSDFTSCEQFLITVEGYNDLPIERIKFVPRSKKPYYVSYLDKTYRIYKPAGKAQQSKEHEGHHRIKLTLVVDQNSLPFLYQEPFIIPEIVAFPQKLAAKADLDVHVIGFFDNSSVICVSDENGYKFLNEWNGLFGYDLYLSFEQEEPTILTDSNNVKNNDPFVVYDLVQVLSMAADGLKVDPKWGFKVIITTDPEHPVLLQFETFLGIRKVATPVFLMALLLKQHIKAIEKETGKKPNKLGFCLFTDYTNEEKKRIYNGLQEACKLSSIGFVNV